VADLIFSLSPERVCLMSSMMSLGVALTNCEASTYMVIVEIIMGD
jgi:hypothetical protein